MKNVVETIDEKYSMKKYDLEYDFIKELKDEAFAHFINKIKYPREKLINYLSILKESNIEYKNCLNCKSLSNCQNKIIGYCYLPKVVDGTLSFNYDPCKYMKKNIDDNKYQKNIYLFKMPKDIRGCSFKEIYKEDKNRFPTIKWLTNFVKSYKQGETFKGLYLNGNFGCGKTYLIAATFNELAKHNVRSAIVFWPEYLSELKSSIGIDFKERFEYIKTVPLLLIDDIGAENMTVWARDEVFCPLVQYRMQNNLTTFFTSNLDLKLLEEHFSIAKNDIDVVKARRVIERIRQMTDNIEMISENLRK